MRKERKKRDYLPSFLKKCHFEIFRGKVTFFLMNKNLPSLNAIRFFECAARHGSFTRAAEEMFVTPGAVSKQIKMLEEQLDCRLFSRKGPNIVLTTNGEKLLATVSNALDIIREGVGSISRQADATLTLSVLPSFASIWLMPKIVEFEKEHPQIMLRQHASFAVVDFSVNTNVDAAIRLGRGGWKGLYTRQLTQDRMFPVCSPDLARGIREVADLGKHTVLVDPHPRLHDNQEFGEWKGWFAAAAEPLCINDYRVIDENSTLISAAMLGKGVALMREELIANHLASGDLVRLFDVEYFSQLHYYFVCPKERKDEEKITLFRHWLKKVSQ